MTGSLRVPSAISFVFLKKCSIVIAETLRDLGDVALYAGRALGALHRLARDLARSERCRADLSSAFALMPHPCAASAACLSRDIAPTTGGADLTFWRGFRRKTASVNQTAEAGEREDRHA